ncbi:hypothetical protein FBZ33_4642 [Micromonospora sp. A202]|uniref:hypothetical protein n=1 Tax=Micromonospora sp. A202 TaxID=2572899 RepID=UPI00116B4BB4|nr:hypothetical protein [Micromonospora sp. A202]TQJ24316.1 hypothetical protein FBZ33_4642 [Micromonospora sp. A202]
MESVDPGGPLSDAEVRELTRLLARFASHDLDQWENWLIETSYGPVFMSVSRKLPPGWPEDAFTRIWPMPAHLAEDSSQELDGVAAGRPAAPDEKPGQPPSISG